MAKFDSITKKVSSILSPTGSYTSLETTDKIFYGDISKRAMLYEGPKRNPVILIHGFLGASLVNRENGENIWGNFDIKDSVSQSPEKMHELAHPMELNSPLQKLQDNIFADKILEEVKITLMGLPIHLPAYKELVEILIKGGFQPSHHRMKKHKNFHSLFSFAYDWRKDLQQSAAQLHEFILEKRQYIQQKYEELYGLKNYNVQFDIIAHSMGGLITRYYLRYGNKDMPQDGSLPTITWAGSEHVDRAIIVGTPNAGYLDTFLELLHGDTVQPYPPTVLGTLPSYYQMLPAPSMKQILYKGRAKKPVDVFDPELWIKMDWGLVRKEADFNLKKILPGVNSQEERRKIAIDHLTKCLKRAQQFISAMGKKASLPEDLKLYLVCGNGIKTTHRAKVDQRTGAVEISDYAPGDGKVLSTSAIWDERAGAKSEEHFMNSPIDWTSLLFLRAAHMGITKAHSFEDNLLFLLTMRETSKQKKTFS